MTAPRDIIIKTLNDRFGWMPPEITDDIIRDLVDGGYMIVSAYDYDDDDECYDSYALDLGPYARRDTPFLNLIKGTVVNSKVVEWGMHKPLPTDESPSIQQPTETE